MTAAPTFTAGHVAALAVRLGVMDEVDLEQLRIGMEVELEHGRRDPLTNVTDDDPLLTAKIALAHLRELPDYYTRLAIMEAAAAEGRQLRVRDLMSFEPVTVRDNAPLTVADRLMGEHNVSGLPVVDRAGVLVGVLSRTDVMAAASGPHSAAWQGISVAATMTAPGLTVEADVALVDAAARMEEHRVHRLVVVEPAGGYPIGILSTTDLVRAVAAGVRGSAPASPSSSSRSSPS
jgi:CBS domain-containing protein